MSSEERGPESSWQVFGKKIPRNEIVFFCQIVVVYGVIIASIYNLSTSTNEKDLWISLLSSCLGYLLPNPVIKP